MSDEEFYEAAIRHWMDGTILEQQEEYDNAVCMQGFAAECALKKIMDRINLGGDSTEYSHYGESLFQDIKMILDGDFALTTMLDPACGLRLSAISIPEVNKAYTVCVENYYDAESGIPGIEAEGEIHFPEFISFNDELLQGIELYSDGSQERNQRVNAYKNILTGEDYKKITERMKSWSGEG